ncbi:armadillo-type protein [Scenedesmus sp. NREL 46B-D3]|nr:armadillo-type protein [Scenedesmus sp. NREL 46B-D3]
MFAKLSALVGGGPALNVNVDPHQYDTAWGCWSHHSGTNKEDGSAVSVFKIAAVDPTDVKLVAARNGVRRLKMLRHPNVLAFKDSLEVQEKGQTVLYLVTEAVRPLAMVLQELDLAGQHRQYLATGMLHMTNAVSFINNSCNMIHGNLCMAAVVVTDSLDWKLHGFDLLSEHALTGDFALKQASWMVASQYKPAELAKCEWQAVQQGPSWAVDSWGLGCMMQEVFSGKPLTAVEQLRRTDVIPPALLADYQKLLSSQTGRRLNPAKVAESRFLNNRLVEVVGFMENISLKDSAEKDSFFKKLPAMVPAIPEPVAVRKLLPLLSSSLEFGGAPASAVSSLMLIGRMLSGDEFIRRVVPSLSRLFASSDRNLRRNLLESIDTYGQHLTTDVIEGQIYPPLSAGFTDENAYIRELTLKSILVLAPKMRQATLTQNLLKHLSRLQVDNEPSIRANTTVLLGNIAQYLGDSYCKKVLLNAFGRALKDSFPPARVAALRALIATVQHYDANEVALRALPAVSPLCIDPLAGEAAGK